MNTPLPGLGLVATAAESARQTLLLLRHQRVLWIMVVVAAALGCLGFVLGGRVHERLDGRGLFCMLAWWLQATVLVPWTTLYLGVQAVHGPLEDRTFQYTFLRPVGRAPLLFGKWLAVAVVAMLAAWAGVTILFLAVAARSELWVDGVDWSLLVAFLELLAFGAFAYAAVAAFFGAYFRRPLIWGAFFVVGLQMLAANLPVSAGLRRLTVTDPLRRLLLDGVEPDQRLARLLWPAEREFKPDMIGHPTWDLVVFTIVCLALGLWSHARTEYDSRSRE